MNLATTTRLFCGRINNIHKLGGYVTRDIATVEDFKIKWTRAPVIREIDPRQSGDLGLDIHVDQNDIRLYYENSKEWEGANDLVRKMFSIKFQRAKEVRNLKRERAMALVKRHVCDRGSTESRIAAMTSEILYFQQFMKEYPRNVIMKVYLKELIDKRRKFLNDLRKWDYKRFEWVLERMNLVFKATPVKEGPVSRKDSLRILTQQHCDNIVQSKLNAYKKELKAQQKNFYREKAEKLAFILKEEKRWGLKPSVTEEDIEAARKKAEELSN
ncbi:28S ribosomal protein S15, mitochondrial [Hylaeus anthracinus]|uniref:28S ribosomal protein S15, mitochondrial n=1 Tax=Hylaeus anthracinus TaxID=313031 RepID=UPI0023B9FAD7|nr:28S ribosomal protein S15, mitochondrial [Hylaeus anthracinus]XP_053995501.1 28S ribosomal protein S15, mitochondrial [Hylaeus anthracinus]